jgi:hypothetical protein
MKSEKKLVKQVVRGHPHFIRNPEIENEPEIGLVLSETGFSHRIVWKAKVVVVAGLEPVPSFLVDAAFANRKTAKNLDCADYVKRFLVEISHYLRLSEVESSNAIFFDADLTISFTLNEPSFVER